MQNRQVHEPLITTSQKIADEAHFYAVKADAAYLAVIFTYLSNLGSASKAFLESHAHIFFPIAAIIKIFEWFTYSIKLYFAPNKNADGVANLAIKTMETILIGIAVWGAKIIGTTLILGSTVGVGPIIFAALFSFGVLYNTARALYFGTKAYISNSKGDVVAEKFYREQAKQAGLNIIFTALGLGTILLTLVFPQVMFPIAAAVAVTAISVILLNVIFRGTRFGDWLQSGIDKVKNLFSPREETVESLNINHLNIQTISNNNISYNIDSTSKNDYYANTIQLQRPIDEENLNVEFINLLGEIDHYKQGLEDALNKKLSLQQRLFPETEKRQNKIEALDFLQTFMSRFKNIVTSKDNLIALNSDSEEMGIKSIIIGKHEFIYNEAEDLVELINDHIVNTYDEAFQSFFKDTGGVETLFKKAYNILKIADNSELLDGTEFELKQKHDNRQSRYKNV